MLCDVGQEVGVFEFRGVPEGVSERAVCLPEPLGFGGVRARRHGGVVDDLPEVFVQFEGRSLRTEVAEGRAGCLLVDTQRCAGEYLPVQCVTDSLEQDATPDVVEAAHAPGVVVHRQLVEGGHHLAAEGEVHRAHRGVVARHHVKERVAVIGPLQAHRRLARQVAVGEDADGVEVGNVGPQPLRGDHPGRRGTVAFGRLAHRAVGVPARVEVGDTVEDVHPRGVRPATLDRCLASEVGVVSAEEVEVRVRAGVVVEEDAVLEVVGPQVQQPEGGLGVALRRDEVGVLGEAVVVEPPLAGRAVEDATGHLEILEHRPHRPRVTEVLGDENDVQAVGVAVLSSVLDVLPGELWVPYRRRHHAGVLSHCTQTLGQPKNNWRS